MGTQYLNKSILDVLKLAKQRQLLLPDIQRDYVWKTDQIENLFDSLLKGYPIGSFIFWKTTRKIINEDKPNLYYFSKDFHKGVTKNEKAEEVFSDDQDYYVVLDGQQRITSLYIALFGAYTMNSRGRYPRELKKELYYNFDSHRKDENGEWVSENPFCFLTEEDAQNDNNHYFKINKLLNADETYGKTVIELDRDLRERGYANDIIDKIEVDLERLHTKLSEDSVIHYYSIENMNYDATLDIFVRVNSSGTPLSKTDLIFSTLINGWEGVTKDTVSKFLDGINEKDFQFTKDYLMRFSLLAVDANTSLKITSFTQEIISKIRNQWDNIQKSLRKLSEILKYIGIYDAQILSYNATMVVAYYIFKGGKIDLKKRESLKDIQKYLWIAFAKNLFAGSSDTMLHAIRKAIDENMGEYEKFSLKMFSSILLNGRNFIVTEAVIDDWLTHKKGENNVFLLLSLLYPNLKLDVEAFHQDHCHPDAGFDKITNFKVFGENAEKIQKNWKEKKDCVPNLQLWKGPENQSKGKKPLKEWVEEDPQKHRVEYLPEGMSLEFKDFEKFFEARRQEMKNELMRIFEVSSTPNNG